MWAMAAAILVDATIVRMLLVPAMMHLLGRSSWWLPGGLDRAVPQLHIERHPGRLTATPVASRWGTEQSGRFGADARTPPRLFPCSGSLILTIR